MTLQLTPTILLACGVKPLNVPTYIQPINDHLLPYGITTPLRLAYFLSQVLHESNRLGSVVENLNYSEERLWATWPHRFQNPNAATLQGAHVPSAKDYAHNPQKLANYVYANRNGNGDVASNDGWNFRGRSLIQLTFRDTYKLVGKHYNVDYLTHPEYLERPTDAALGAFWYWTFFHDHSLNFWADKDDIATVTKLINGGYNGLTERKAFLILAKRALGIIH